MVRQRLAFLSVAVALVAVVVGTAWLIVADTHARHAADQSAASNARKWPLPPGYRQVCAGGVTSECARRAAMRVGHDVAWIASARAVTPVGIIYRGKQASLELRFATDDGLLDSAPVVAADAPNLPTQMKKPGTYRFSTLTVDGNSLQLLTTSAGGIAFTKLTWTHGGQTFSLGETASGTSPPDVSPLLALWRQVQYATAGANV